MKFLTLILVLSCSVGHACELDGSKEERERDLRFQEFLVEKTAKEADVIASGKVLKIKKARLGRNRGPTPIEFLVEKWLKVPSTLSDKKILVLKADLLVTSVICLPSDRFNEDQVTVGDTVIIYGKNGTVLRAAAENRESGEIEYAQELTLLVNRVGP